jgi:hypothetical protein
MHECTHFADGSLHLAVVSLVSILAFLLVLLVRPHPPATSAPERYHAEGFDHGSFRDLGLPALFSLPFFIMYVLINWQ